MELKTIYGDVIFALDTAKTVAELVTAALAAKKSLSYANLSYANLSYAELSSANLSYAELSSANLSYANLSYANLSYANLSYADLRSANLSYAELSSANLSYADLRYADLRYANLRYAKNAELVIARMQFIPTTGSFHGWKKCRDGVIVELGITVGAKRSHGTERKCRCSRARVLDIRDSKGNQLQEAVSCYDRKFIYRLGKMAVSNGWDEDRWNTCGQGIHFYITKEEAEAHQ